MCHIERGGEARGLVVHRRHRNPDLILRSQESWQPGTAENTNGILRQYFPKKTDMATLTQAELDAVAHFLNARPRQTLG